MERDARDGVAPSAADEPERRGRTRATYDAVAPDFLRRTRDRSWLAATLEDFVARLPVGARVLDLGAGPGIDTATFRAHGLRAVAMDLSRGMLLAGRAEFPAPRVQADMRRLPFRRGLHGIWAQASLLHLDRAELSGVLRGLRAILVPPSLLHVTLKRGAGEGWETKRYGAAQPRWFAYWEPDALDDAIAAAGFRVLEATTRRGSEDVWLARLATAEPAGSAPAGAGAR
jgi:SAM-dependent methyltransferase